MNHGGMLARTIWTIEKAKFHLRSTRAGATVAYTIAKGITLKATVCDLFFWKKFKGTESSQKFLTALFHFYITGLIHLADAGS